MLSIVDNHTFKRLFFQVLEHTPSQDDITAFFQRFQAVLVTRNLAVKGIRRVLKAAGYEVTNKRRGLAANLAAYLDVDRKAAIDWAWRSRKPTTRRCARRPGC
jgi:hypothetical protein